MSQTVNTESPRPPKVSRRKRQWPRPPFEEVAEAAQAADPASEIVVLDDAVWTAAASFGQVLFITARLLTGNPVVMELDPDEALQIVDELLAAVGRTGETDYRFLAAKDLLDELGRKRTGREAF